MEGCWPLGQVMMLESRVNRKEFPRILIAAVLLVQLSPLSPLGAQESRPGKLIEGAHKEGKLVWYTSMSIEDAKRLVDAFNKKHPFVQTEFFRAGSAGLFNRIVNEARIGKVFFDVVAIRGLETHQLIKGGLLQPYFSPESQAYPPGFKHPKGLWVDYFDAYQVIGYNTRLVPKDRAPKSYDDLLDPRWKGRIGMDEELYSWYGAMVQKWGKEKAQRFMQGLAKQEVQLRSGQTLAAQLLAAGEFAIAMVLAHRVEKMKEQGAPLEWVTTLDPIAVSLHPIGLAAKAAHPNAGKLFIDFVLSKEGQKVVLDVGRTPARPGIDLKMDAKSLQLYPVPPELGENYPQYLKEFREIFGR